MSPLRPLLLVCLLIGIAAPVSEARAAGEFLTCTMTFTLEGWSVFYKTAEGEGVVNCSDGQRLPVRISSRGAGLTFGKSRIEDGWGEFSGINSIRDVLGSYAAAEAEAGAVRSAQAQVVTKGSVTLALRGNGDGWNIGVSVGRFTLSPR